LRRSFEHFAVFEQVAVPHHILRARRRECGQECDGRRKAPGCCAPDMGCSRNPTKDREQRRSAGLAREHRNILAGARNEILIRSSRPQRMDIRTAGHEIAPTVILPLDV
jgi:hypothetical protein